MTIEEGGGKREREEVVNDTINPLFTTVHGM